MSDYWISREIEKVFRDPRSPLRLFPIWLIIGPRQVGKSSVLQKIGQENNRNYISLDDLETRTRANYDPALFLRELVYPVTIDEIQYAPILLSGLKHRVDQSKIPGEVWLSGSQNFEVMRGVRESLAGRVAILNLFGLSTFEKIASNNVTNKLFNNNPIEIFNNIIETTFPKLYRVQDEGTRSLFLSSYIQTYIERDVRELLGIQKRREFEIFVKLCAVRTGQILNFDELARDSGISAVTAKEWIGVLEDSFLIKLIYPYYNNRSKRLIKSPKLYFTDTGLAAYLAGWRQVEQLRLSPVSGFFFENYVFSNILATLSAKLRDFQIHFWRTRDGQEIDFLIETLGCCYPIEVKMGSVKPQELLNLDKIKSPNWSTGTIISLVGKEGSINEDWQQKSLIKFLEEI